MKKFQFELQDILDVKKFEEDAATAELAKALAVETEIQNKLDSVAAQYIAAKTELKGTSDARSFISGHQFYKFLEYQKEELLKELAEANLVTDEKRKILTEIMQKTQALEKLKEEALSEYNAQANLEEENNADEINSIRFNINKLTATDGGQA
ncbi:MAG: flagellar export protein FliJ [Treponema sp.]|nr:flagellar export protein FliJ [Treponema sp.]